MLNQAHEQGPRLMAKGAQFKKGLRSRYRPASRLAFVGVELPLLSAAAANAEAATGGGYGSGTGTETAVSADAPDSIRCRRSDGARRRNDSVRGARMAGSLKAEAPGAGTALWALRTLSTWPSW